MAVDAHEPEKEQNRGALGIVFLTLFLDLVGFSIIFPLLPAMLDYYLPGGASDGSLLGRIVAPLAGWAESSGAEDPRFMTAVLFGGILGSLYSALQCLCAPLWGAWSDRVGRRKALRITIAGLALSYLLWFFAASFWTLALARVVGGVMGGNISVATAAVADVTSRKKRSSGLALVGMAFGLGFIVGPAVGGLLSLVDLTELLPQLEAFGVNPFSTPALAALALSALNFIWVSRSFKETLPEAKRKQVAAKKQGFVVFRIFAAGGAEIRRANLLYLIFLTAFSGMEFTLTFLAVERFAFSPAQNGGMFIFIGLALALVQGCIVRRLAEPVGEKRLAVVGLACGVAAFVALALSLQTGLFFVGLAALAFSIGLCSPTLSALVSLYSSESEQGANLGLFRSAGSLARAIGPLAAALIYFTCGSQCAYLIGAGIAIVPLLMALKLPQPEREAA